MRAARLSGGLALMAEPPAAPANLGGRFKPMLFILGTPWNLGFVSIVLFYCISFYVYNCSVIIDGYSLLSYLRLALAEERKVPPLVVGRTFILPSVGV